MGIQLESFILGMCLVLVIAMAVVSVYTIVKVMKLKNDYTGLSVWSAQEFEKLQKVLKIKDIELEHKIGIIYRDIDSRFDKLYEKMMKTKSPKNEVFEMADKDGFRNEDEGKDLKNRILELRNKEGKESSISK